ncbi:MAG: hypothetical protein HYS70_06880 [Nitrospinae bacterium]|nr:hypothetical protein [Nitrospinota bacterium]
MPAVTTFHHLRSGPVNWRQRIELSCDLGENTKMYFDYNWFSGKSDTTYGGWDDWDQIRIGVTHKF